MATKNPSIAETSIGERAHEGPMRLPEAQTGFLSLVLGEDYPTTRSYVKFWVSYQADPGVSFGIQRLKYRRSPPRQDR